MSAVYTKRFVSIDLGAGLTSDTVVPAGKTWVIRNIIALCDTAASQMVCAIYGPVGHTLAVAAVAANVLSVFNEETRIVLYAGETLRCIAVAQGPWHITITGYEFT